MEKTGEEQSVPSDHSVNRLSARNAISSINTQQTAPPPNTPRTKTLRFMITSQLGNSLWPPPTKHFLFLRSPGARLGAPAASETRLSGQRDQGACRLRG